MLFFYLGFGNVVLYPKNYHYGLLILRFPNYFNAEQIAMNLKRFLTKINPKILINAIIVLEPGRCRVRK